MRAERTQSSSRGAISRSHSWFRTCSCYTHQKQLNADHDRITGLYVFLNSLSLLFAQARALQTDSQ
jgi:hypothetical protein